VTTAATTTTTAVTRPKARGVVVEEPSEFTTTTSQPSQLPHAKDKGKAKMIEPEKPLKKKDQFLIDEEIAQRLQEELQAELEEEESQLKNKSFEEIQMLFDNTMKCVDSFVPMDSKDVEGNENIEAEVDDKAEIKKHIKIVVDEEEIAVDAIPLANKPPIIKLVKAKHRNTRPEEAYERVLWGDLKVMFEPDAESEVWRNLQGYNVTVWKLFSFSGVHSVRFQNLHIFMLVEKKYPLTPATIKKMLNKKLQAG
ncbi:hypothetical protein Tco_1034266, partial [Tanacetum coccineum]